MRRLTVYLDKENARKLQNHKNKSKIVKEALNNYFSNKKILQNKKEELETEISQLNMELGHKKYMLSKVSDEIRGIDSKNSYRPKKYVESVNMLLNLDNVSEKDLQFQADGMGIELAVLKEWLKDDDYYEKIFDLEKKS